MCNARCLGGVVGFLSCERGEAGARTCCGELEPVELAVDAADLAGGKVNSPPFTYACMCLPYLLYHKGHGHDALAPERRVQRSMIVWFGNSIDRTQDDARLPAPESAAANR